MTTIRRPPNFSSACAEPQRLCERSFECLPLVPAICSSSRSNSSPSALSPTCCTHSNSACLLRAIPSIIGSNSCCVVNSRPPPACFASRLFALFLIGGSFPPRGRCCWHDPFSGRPGAAATYSNFNIRGDIAQLLVTNPQQSKARNAYRWKVKKLKEVLTQH